MLPCLLRPATCPPPQSLLDAWRAELARQPLSMSEADACGVLGITPGPDGAVPEEELKAAYRRWGAALPPVVTEGWALQGAALFALFF